jgi:hypothetical protein
MLHSSRNVALNETTCESSSTTGAFRGAIHVCARNLRRCSTNLGVLRFRDCSQQRAEHDYNYDDDTAARGATVESLRMPLVQFGDFAFASCRLDVTKVDNLRHEVVHL